MRHWRSFLKWIIAVIVAVAFVTPSIAAAAAAATAAAPSDNDEAGVRSAVKDLTRFEKAADAEALYDRLAPDARNIMPRSVWVAWYGLEPRLIPTAAATIDSIDFDDWTWDATGESFANVAVVHLTQRGTLGSKTATQRQTLHLVDVDDEWRWFPLDDPSDITDAVDAADAVPAYTTPFTTRSYASIDTFWAQNFAAADQDYKRPAHITAVTRNLQVAAGCGTAKDVEDAGIYYCTLSNSIYFAPDMRDSVTEYIGDWAWAEILAHEWGHYIQDLAGIEGTDANGDYAGMDIELQADCLSGMYIQNEYALGHLDDADLEQIGTIIDLSGDEAGTKSNDPDAHGTSKQREASFQNGFDNGFTGCDLDLTSF